VAEGRSVDENHGEAIAMRGERPLYDRLGVKRSLDANWREKTSIWPEGASRWPWMPAIWERFLGFEVA
jgi:hypothetical protein